MSQIEISPDILNFSKSVWNFAKKILREHHFHEDAKPARSADINI